MPNQLPKMVEERIVSFSIAHPGLGPRWPDPVCWTTACESRWVVAVGKVVGLADGLSS